MSRSPVAHLRRRAATPGLRRFVVALLCLGAWGLQAQQPRSDGQATRGQVSRRASARVGSQQHVAEGAPTGGADDFGPANQGWNGLTYLLETASEADVDVQIAATLDFSRLDASEVLIVVAPQRDLSPIHQDNLLRFVAAGGRVVVADDFAAGASWVQPFAIRRLAVAGAAPAVVDGRPSLPIFRGDALGAFLGFQVDAVVLNHPASFVVEPLAPKARSTEEIAPMQRQALGRYADGVRAWLVEIRSGQGRALALADPSILINGMLRGYHGDKQLAANLMRWGCYAGEPCKVTLLPNIERVQGSFRAPPPPLDRARSDLFTLVETGLERLAALLRRSEFIPVGWLLVVLALVVPPLLGGRMPVAKLPLTAAPQREHSRLHDTVAAWLGQPNADFRRPARQLATHLSRLVMGQEGREGVGTMELRGAIAVHIADGRLSARAGQRLEEVVATLGEVASGANEVDRARFTLIAAEVEWAEHVLSHTGGPPDPSGVASTLGRLTGATNRRKRDKSATKGERQCMTSSNRTAPHRHSRRQRAQAPSITPS